MIKCFYILFLFWQRYFNSPNCLLVTALIGTTGIFAVLCVPLITKRIMRAIEKQQDALYWYAVNSSWDLL